MAKRITKSSRLDDVLYDIRGPVMKTAEKMESEGQEIIKLNIGNPAPWGFLAPEEILNDVIRNIPNSQGYSDSKGIYSARKAIMQYHQSIGVNGVDVDQIYIGNGVSELITMSTQALLEEDDEVLVPSPDYPLWTASTSLCGARPVHYICDEADGWQPDEKDIRSKITEKTKAIVIINPNNPTGAVYSKDKLIALLAIAKEHELVVMADEIYDKIIYDDAEFIPIASLAEDIFVVSFGGLSKSHRVAGFRSGWMVVSGKLDDASDYVEGLDLLSSTRLCANVPSQHAIQAALGGHQSILELTKPGGRLITQRDLAWEMLNEIDGVSCTKPKGAFYLFPKLDIARFNILDDERFVLDLLTEQKVLAVHGGGFHWPTPDHFRLVFLPHLDQLSEAIGRIKSFLGRYQQA